MAARLPVVLLGLLLIVASADAQTSRIAYFSPERAFAESAFGQAVRAGLEKLQAEKAKEIEDRGATLRERQQAFERNASILTETAREQRLRDLERFELDVKRFIEDAQAELMGARRQAEGAFLAKLGPVVEAVAKKRELHLVLNQDTGIVIWGVPEVDITSEVVAELGTR